jgi:hypothetical protein
VELGKQAGVRASACGLESLHQGASAVQWNPGLCFADARGSKKLIICSESPVPDVD